MPSEQRESQDIDQVLGDLHRRKRWLDTIIQGLEQAIESPEIRLIHAAEAAFQDESGPRIDLQEDQGSLLRMLALKIRRRRHSGEEEPIDEAEEAA